MCEIFGVSSRKSEDRRAMLREFFSHSDANPHGWGIADLSGGDLRIIKEPVKADDSRALADILDSPLKSDLLLAHIRLATKGAIEALNTHPFTAEDDTGTRWTLVHNGTIFESEDLSLYTRIQKGSTDSERILCFLTDQMSGGAHAAPLPGEARFRIMEELLYRITPENKVNLLVTDGEYLYAHTNFKGSLYMMREDGDAVFSSKPLGKGSWEELPLNTLLVFREGEQVYSGSPHGNEFFETEEKMRFLFLDYAGM